MRGGLWNSANRTHTQVQYSVLTHTHTHTHTHRHTLKHTHTHAHTHAHTKENPLTTRRRTHIQKQIYDKDM